MCRALWWRSPSIHQLDIAMKAEHDVERILVAAEDYICSRNKVIAIGVWMQRLVRPKDPLYKISMKKEQQMCEN